MRHPQLSACLRALKTASAVSWKPTGAPQRTLASEIVRSGTGLHSGAPTTARLIPAAAGEGRFFSVTSPSGARTRIPATVSHAVESPLCTTLHASGARVRTVEHLLSALEAAGVDNCRIEIDGGEEVPLLDGSAKEWMEAIEEVQLTVAQDCDGNSMEKLAPFLHEPTYVRKGDSFIAAFPSSRVHVTYGIDFPEVPSIGSQWYSCPLDVSTYSKQIAPSRTFCIYEEVEKMCSAGLIQGGTAENALVCSATVGWLNPPLRFHDEPCRHKVLDLVGDFSLLAQDGNQGLPIAHILAYKAGHSLHVQFVGNLSEKFGSSTLLQDKDGKPRDCSSSSCWKDG